MQKLAGRAQNGANANPAITQKAEKLPIETSDYLQQPCIVLPQSEKLIAHWTKRPDKGPDRGIFFDCTHEGLYTALLGYTKDEEKKRLMIDIIRFREDVPHEIGARLIDIKNAPNPETVVLKNSNVIEAAIKFCAINGLGIFTTSALLVETIEGTYGKIEYGNGLVEILSLEKAIKSGGNSLVVKEIKVELRTSSD